MVGNFKMNDEICIGIHLDFNKDLNLNETSAIDKIKLPPIFLPPQGSPLMPVSCGFEN